VIVIQEWWGVNDHIRSIVDRLASAGFVALAPDLFHGAVTADATEAMRLMTELDGDRSMDEIAGAVTFLAGHPRGNGKVGIIGFCMGGAFALRAAANIPELAAAVPFYGLPDSKKADTSKIRCPVLGHYAAKDQFVKAERALAIQDEMRARGQEIEIHVYDADHAFVNDTRPEVHAPEHAKVAWDRTVAFLKKHVG
jgi:carboxymethylenebutenolidase